jgi:hypothetical protein
MIRHIMKDLAKLFLNHTDKMKEKNKQENKDVTT